MATVEKDITGFHVWNYKFVELLPKSIQLYHLDYWKTERLVWLAFLKNKDTSLLGGLPKELIKIIAGMLHPQQPTSGNSLKRTAEDLNEGPNKKILSDVDF